MLLQYVGRSATVRIVRREDFKRYNIEHDDVTFDVADIPTRGQAELSDEAAELLLKLEPVNFREVDDGDRALFFRKKS
jgi:hypothetical protein